MQENIRCFSRVSQRWFNVSLEKAVCWRAVYCQYQWAELTTVWWGGKVRSTDLLPYILHMDVVWARLISISSDRLCFQCRMSVSFSALISLCAVLPCVAPCWTKDWMPRDARYWNGEDYQSVWWINTCQGSNMQRFSRFGQAMWLINDAFSVVFPLMFWFGPLFIMTSLWCYCSNWVS